MILWWTNLTNVDIKLIALISKLHYIQSKSSFYKYLYLIGNKHNFICVTTKVYVDW